MKIYKLNLRRLRNEEHFQFMTDVKGLVELPGAEALNIDALYPQFLTLYGKEDAGLEVVRSLLTDPIADADVARDEVLYGFTLQVESYTHSPNDAKAQAARNIQVIIEHYGNIRTRPYNEETAVIHNLLQDINNRTADVATLNLQTWVDELTVANQTFDDLMNQRFDATAQQGHVNLAQTRREIDGVYTDIINRIDASILLNGENAYAAFVDKLNERIQYFKNTLAVRKGRAGKVTRGENPET